MSETWGGATEEDPSNRTDRAESLIQVCEHIDISANGKASSQVSLPLPSAKILAMFVFIIPLAYSTELCDCGHFICMFLLDARCFCSSNDDFTCEPIKTLYIYIYAFLTISVFSISTLPVSALMSVLNVLFMRRLVRYYFIHNSSQETDHSFYLNINWLKLHLQHNWL